MWSRCPSNKPTGRLACGSTRTVSRSTAAHDTQRPDAAPELLDVRHAGRRDLSGKRRTRDERGCQLVSLRSSTRRRYFGGECASGCFYSAIRRCFSRLAQRRHRGNPVLATLHSLSSAGSLREVWWIYGARNRAEHPFAKESRGLSQTLVNSRSRIVYSKPDSGDKAGVDYDSVGHVDTPLTPLLDSAGCNLAMRISTCAVHRHFSAT
jgi:hypothetical protein